MAKDEEIIVDVEEVYSNTEKWVIENQKSLTIIVGAIVLLLGSFFAFKKLCGEATRRASQRLYLASAAGIC